MNGPQVGDKIGYYYVSDINPCTVVAVKNNGKTIVVHDNKVGPNKLVWPEQDFPIYEETEGSAHTFTLRKNGRYVIRGTSMNGSPALTNSHCYYRDPHF